MNKAMKDNTSTMLPALCYLHLIPRQFLWQFATTAMFYYIVFFFGLFSKYFSVNIIPGFWKSKASNASKINEFRIQLFQISSKKYKLDLLFGKKVRYNSKQLVVPFSSQNSSIISCSSNF